MQVRHVTVTAYERGGRLVIAGDGFGVSVASKVGPVDYEVDDGTLVIECNEARAEAASHAAACNNLEPTVRDVDLPVVVDEEASVEYVAGHWENTPIYSPYYGVTPDGTVYEFSRAPNTIVYEADALLDFDDPGEDFRIVRNTRAGWAEPVGFDRISEWFDGEQLRAAVQVRG